MIANSDLIALLNSHPEGLTTSDIAKFFNAEQQTAASRLSKLYNYGMIGRYHPNVKYNRAHWVPLKAPRLPKAGHVR
jgi:predicted transcriptional regulator